MFLQNTFRAFRHRDYLIFWSGFFLGHTGTLIQTTAQGWLILLLTDSPFYLGLNGLCLGLPRVLFSPLGGAVADRLNRRQLLVFTQSALMLLAVFLGVMNYLDVIAVWHVLAVSALTGFILSFEQPVRQSILHTLVPREDLINAITLYHLVFNGSILFGPAAGGALIPFIGTAGCFIVHAVANFVVVVTIFMIRIPKTVPTGKKKSLYKDMVEGISMAWQSPIFISLFVTLAVVSFFVRPYTQFMPIFARDILSVGAPGLGLLLTAPGAGAVCGGLIFASITRFPKPHLLLLFLASGFGSTIILFSASRSFVFSLVILFIVGAFQTTLLSTITTFLQSHSKAQHVGRIMSLYGLINRGLGPMGALPIGALATKFGAPLTIAFGGILAIITSAYVTLRGSHWRNVKAIGEP